MRRTNSAPRSMGAFCERAWLSSSCCSTEVHAVTPTRRLARSMRRKNCMIEMKNLATNFRHVRLLLAREKGRPEGERQEGYDLLVPLDRDGRLGPQDWKAYWPSAVSDASTRMETLGSGVCGASPAGSVLRLSRGQQRRRDRLFGLARNVPLPASTYRSAARHPCTSGRAR